MSDAMILYHRRRSDWRFDVFSFVGLPPLSFGKVDGGAYDPREVIKPLYAAECLQTARGRARLDEAAGIKVFHAAFKDKKGEALESAAAELLLPDNPKTGSSDYRTFVTWAARRAQPLDERLVEAFGRFYIARLNRFLSKMELPSAPKHGFLRARARAARFNKPDM